MFETTAFDLRNLEDEHAEIRRRYSGLEKAILCGRGLPRILDAADSLVQMMLLHFTHEEQFLVKLPLSSNLPERHRNANIEVTAKLFSIEAGLKQGSAASVFHLLRLGRFWMNEHLHLENEEFECEGLVRKERTSLVRRALGVHPAAVARSNR
jgi:hemerythrin